MTTIIVAVALAATGAVMLLFGLFPPEQSLSLSLERLRGAEIDDDSELLDPSGAGYRRFAGSVGRSALGRWPTMASSIEPDLAINGDNVEGLSAKVLGYGGGLTAITVLIGLALSFFGFHLGIGLLLLMIVGFAVGAGLPIFDLRSNAKKRRAHFLHTMSTYTSLVAMAIAGSMGWNSALEAASSVSTTDWGMTEIAKALLWSQSFRRPPWEGLDNLATKYNLPILTDMARSMAQAGDGAKIKETLLTKSSSYRLKEQVALEADLQASTQRMILPGAFLMLGFMLLIFYPALAPLAHTHIGHAGAINGAVSGS